ncbi:coiled-coil domain-containing protein 190 [Nycticebus coucang]|uniref:coiled-coil domain-containing protein 190 n=1 Tax=Nycticebus coucang TaxID=9470 RepID=UPI00234DC7BF|nr:coiled-coil domain-containing protein 190 [Nycticebus coucang]
MERHMLRGPLYRDFDLERRNAKQAEARLGQRLQRLEDIRLYHLKLLTREQRQLQKELQRLQQADIRKKKVTSYLGSGIEKRPEDVFMFSPQEGQKHRVSHTKKIRALATSVTKEIYKTTFQMPPLHHSGPKTPTRSKEPQPCQNTAFFTEEKPQAQEKGSVNPPDNIDSNEGIPIPCQDQEVSTNSTELGPGSGPTGDIIPHTDVIESKDVTPKLDGNAGKQIPLNPMDHARSFSGKFTKPTFLELFAKAKNAHYLRHRVPPESERLLSIGEIFGHSKSSLSRAGRECENIVPTSSFPL